MQSPRSLKEIREKAQQLLGKDMTNLFLLGSGAVSNAYVIETAEGEKYVVKCEKEAHEFQSQNTLLIEARVAQELDEVRLSIPVPRVAFLSEEPVMYGYEYIEGDLLKTVWEFLTEKERLHICKTLGIFHAEIGGKISKESAAAMGVVISDSTGLHPETMKEYNSILESEDVPEEIKNVARFAKAFFDATTERAVFQFIHNDAHHENIIVRDKQIVGIIDFGNAEYGEVAKEFSRYIRDFPDYFEHIVSSYEEASGNSLSRERLVSNAYLSGLIDIVEYYRQGGDDRAKAEQAILVYQRLFQSCSKLTQNLEYALIK